MIARSKILPSRRSLFFISDVMFTIQHVCVLIIMYRVYGPGNRNLFFIFIYPVKHQEMLYDGLSVFMSKRAKRDTGRADIWHFSCSFPFFYLCHR